MKSLFQKLLDPSLLRFLIVGGINTVVGMAIMFGLYNLAECSYWLSSAANYGLTSTLSFFLNKYFTFRSKSWSGGEVIRFATGASAAVRDNVSMLVGMVLFTGCNYLGQRFFAFKQTDGKENGTEC